MNHTSRGWPGLNKGSQLGKHLRHYPSKPARGYGVKNVGGYGQENQVLSQTTRPGTAFPIISRYVAHFHCNLFLSPKEIGCLVCLRESITPPPFPHPPTSKMPDVSSLWIGSALPTRAAPFPLVSLKTFVSYFCENILTPSNFQQRRLLFSLAQIKKTRKKNVTVTGLKLNLPSSPAVEMYPPQRPSGPDDTA